MNTTTDTYSIIYNYLDIFWRRRYIMAVIMISLPILGLLLGIFIPKRYEATTSLATFKTAPPSMKELIFIPDISEQFAGISAYITSTSTLQKVLVQAGIVSPDADEKTTEEIANDLSKRLTISLVDKTVVQIKLIGSNQKDMMAILKALSAVFITEFLTPLTSATQSAEGFLKKQVEIQQQKLKESISQLSNFEMTNSTYLPKYGAIYTTRLGQIINELGAAETEYKMLVAEKTWLENTLSNVNPAFVRLEKEISENDAKLNQMRAIYTDNYAGIQASLQLAKSLKEEREKLQGQSPRVEESKLQKLLDTELYSPEKLSGNDKASAGISTKLKDYQVLEQRIKGLSGRVQDLTNQKKELSHTLSQVDSTEKNLSFLMKAVTENQEVYQDLQKRYDMTRMTMQLNHFERFSPIKIVSYPQGPLLNTAKPLIFYPLIALIGGIFLSLGLALMLDFMDNSIRRKQTLESLTGLLVISRVEKINFT